MKKTVYVLLVLLVMFGMLAAAPMAALADCAENAVPNPDVWTCDNLPVNDTDGMDATTNDPADDITVDSGATVTNPGGSVTIEMMDGTLTNDGSVSNSEISGAAILAGGDSDITNNGTVTQTGDSGTGIFTLNGDVVNDGTVTVTGAGATGIIAETGNVENNDTISAAGGTGIATGDGDNTVELGAGSSTSGDLAAIYMGNGNDTVTVNQNATVDGLIDGGLGTDTLEFAFLTQSQLAGLDPALGMYGTYTWANFEFLIGQLIKAAHGKKHVYFRNKEINARGVGNGNVTGITVLAEPGKIAFVPFSALRLINFGGGGVRFQFPNPENWFVVVVNLGPYEDNPERNLYQVFIHDGNGALVSNEQSFVY
jgi:hypothetical protein